MRCVDAQANDDTGPAGDQTVGFTVTGANPQATEVATNASGYAQFCYTGANAGLDTITAFVDSNDNNTKDASEPQETATKRWLATQPTITLEPPTGDNPIGTTHKLTATVTERRRPGGGRAGRVLRAGRQRQREHLRGDRRTRFAVTDANGQATCTYTGYSGGTDTILAFADTNSNFAPRHRRAERHGDEALAHAGRDEPRPHA